MRRASSDIDAFCDETGRTRRRANEYTPVNASWEGAKVPPYGVPVENVTYEYHAKAKPGVGEVTKEKGYKSENSRHETKVANDLVRQIGGNITQIKRSEGEPDYKWRGTFWEVKETSSANSVDKQTEHALNQTVKYGGNIIIDYDGKEEINYKSIILNRVRRSAKHSFDIFVLRNGEIKGIYRYKK